VSKANSTESVAVDALQIEATTGTSYPPPLDKNAIGRIRHKLGDVYGLNQFGVNLVELAPGAESALRHWHAQEDEFIYVLEGTPSLVMDSTEQLLKPGMCVGFKSGVANAHHLCNRSDSNVRYLEVGSRIERDACFYPDDDLMWLEVADGAIAIHKDGSPYPER